MTLNDMDVFILGSSFARWIVFRINTMADAREFIAVPTIVWSALNLIDMNESKKEKATPTKIDINIPSMYMKLTKNQLFNKALPSIHPYICWINKIPEKAPTNIEPSREILMIPEHSLNIPPKEPRVNPTPKTINRNIIEPHVAVEIST